MKKIVLFSLIFLQSIGLFAQKDDVNKYLKLVAYGKIDEVRDIIPDLLAKYPNDAGVKLLHGTVLDDAFLAVDVYNSIIKNYPESEWADHAYWRIVQFYAVIGDTSKAQAELTAFRAKYPSSPFLTPASDVVRSSVNAVRKNIRSSTAPVAAKSTNTTLPKSTTNDNKAEVELKQTSKDKPVSVEKPTEVVDLNNKKAETKTISEKPSIDRLSTENKANNQSVQKNEKVAEPKVAEKPTLKVEEKKLSSDSEPEFFGLQVGIYKDKNAADAEKNKFLVKRLRTQVIEKNVNGTVMFAVVIGHYSSMESAEEGKKIVSIQCSCEPIIYKK